MTGVVHLMTEPVQLIWAWVLTIPMAGGFAGLYFLLIKLVHYLAT